MRRALKVIAIVVLLILAALLVNAFFVDRKTKPAKETAAARLYETPGGALSVTDQGDRKDPAVVLLHGWTAASNWWDRMTPLLLERGYRVVRLDYLGHGNSAKPTGGYSMKQQADRIAGVLQKLKVRRALIAGHSTGGEIAIALSARHPTLSRKLIVMDSEPNEDVLTIDTLAQASTTALIGQFLWGTAPDSAIKDGLKQAFLDDSVPVPDAFVDDFRSMTFSSYKDTADESASYVDSGDLETDVKASYAAKPVMIMFGAGDRLISVKKSLPIYKDWMPKAKYVLVPGAGHSPLWEQPAATTKAFESFDRRR